MSEIEIPCLEAREAGIVKLAVIADIHFGHPNCKIAGLSRFVSWIEKEPNCWWVSAGDLLEIGTKRSVGAGVYEQIIPPNEQLKRMSSLLRPIAPKCLGMVAGNHGDRIHKDSGIDIDEDLAERIGAPYYRFTMLGVIKMANTMWRYKVHHTGGGGRTAGAPANALSRMSINHPTCDIYIGGHHHSVITDENEYREITTTGKTPRLRIRTRRFFGAGSGLDWDNAYPEQQDLPARPVKQIVLHLGEREHKGTIGSPREWHKPCDRELVLL